MEKCSEFKKLEAIVRLAEVKIVKSIKEIHIQLAVIDHAINNHQCRIPKFDDNDPMFDGLKDLFGFKT